jgi:glycosyltransferase involved in cell wall biosynthesis
MSTLSGHMIVKNGIKYDYPFIESCLSILPICEEFVFVEGTGEDGTYEKLLELRQQYPKIKVIRQSWEKMHYTVLSDLTNVAIENCTSEYHFQIQADEVIHEKYLRQIKEAVVAHNFDYALLGVLHFYGSFRKVYKPGVFYDSFVRMGRRSAYPHLCSHGDAMSLGFPQADPYHYQSLDLRNVLVHHYGYVRKPSCLINKQDEAIKWWGIQERDPLFEKGLERGNINWSDKHSDSALNSYTESHPSVLIDWIAERERMVEEGILE